MDAFYESIRDSDGQLILERQFNSYAFPHFHSCYELMIVTEGEICTNIGGKCARLAAGDLYVAESFNVHSNNTEGSSKTILLIVPETMIRHFIERAGGRALASPFLQGSPASGEILHCMEALLALKNKQETDSLTIKGYLYVIFGLLTEYIGLTENKPEEIKLLPKEILLYMQENFTRSLQLQDIATRFGYSPIYFSRFFRQYFGCGFHEYLILLRLRHAISLVSEENHTFISAALESGFENQRTFNRAFLKVYGTTPSSFISGLRRRRG